MFLPACLQQLCIWKPFFLHRQKRMPPQEVRFSFCAFNAIIHLRLTNINQFVIIFTCLDRKWKLVGIIANNNYLSKTKLNAVRLRIYMEERETKLGENKVMKRFKRHFIVTNNFLNYCQLIQNHFCYECDWNMTCQERVSIHFCEGYCIPITKQEAIFTKLAFN